MTAVVPEDSASDVLLVLVGRDKDQEPSSSQVLGRDHKLLVLIPEMLDAVLLVASRPSGRSRMVRCVWRRMLGVRHVGRAGPPLLRRRQCRWTRSWQPRGGHD